jgi:hypothetical protein
LESNATSNKKFQKIDKVNGRLLRNEDKDDIQLKQSPAPPAAAYLFLVE